MFFLLLRSGEILQPLFYLIVFAVFQIKSAGMQVKDFWSFITNEEVSLSNIQRFIPIIQREILNQYPNFKILDLSSDEWCLKEEKVKWLKNWYREQNGNSLTVKSLKKGYTKTLTIQDK